MSTKMAKQEIYRRQEGEKEEDEKYGCFGWHPRCLKAMNNVKAYVFWICIFNFWEGFIVNGVINVVLVALETRYSLSSIESGLIASANDFGAFVFLLLVGYFGETRHKPRIMAMGTICMALGCLVFTLPHFIGDKYITSSIGADNETLCIPDRLSTVCTPANAKDDNRLYPMFLVGQVILGIGAAPLFTLGLTYIDENTKVKMTSFYTGLASCSAAIGVAVGYIVGGQSLSLFVDINRGEDGSPITPEDKQWVGAWWMGSSIAVVALLLVTLPILGFPKRLPGYAELVKLRESEAHKTGLEAMTARPDFGTTVKDFPRAMYFMMRNPTFIFTCLGGTCDALIIGGTATFGAKLLQELFNVDLSTAGWIMGAITVPGSGGGMILGGYLVRRWKLKCRGILRLCAVATGISLLFTPAWLLKCGQANMAGVRSGYNSLSDPTNSSGLLDACNAQCSCTTKTMDAICSDDGLVYFSPCYAGCRSKNHTTNSYVDCACFQYFHQTVDNGLDLDLHVLKRASSATKGNCTNACEWLGLFSFCFFLIMVFTFCTFSPNVTAVFRCVPYTQRSLAIGCELLFIRLAGTTPGPILFGFVIDSACLVWQDNCGERGSCWLYETDDMTLRIIYWWISLKVAGIISYGLASILYVPPLTNQNIQDENNKHPAISMVSDGTCNGSPYTPATHHITPSQSDTSDNVGSLSAVNVSNTSNKNGPNVLMVTHL